MPPLPTIDPTEVVPLEFDFTDLLSDYQGAAISLPVFTIEVVEGTDATPAARLTGAPDLPGLVVKQYFTPPAPWTTKIKYRVTCTVTVSGVSYRPTIAIEITVNERTDA